MGNDYEQKARFLVEQWNNRTWVRNGTSLHVHPLDLDKLTEMIAKALRTEAGEEQPDD